MIYIGQRFMTVPKDVRSNANFVIGFSQPKNDSDCFYNNVLSRCIDKEEFKKIDIKTMETIRRRPLRLYCSKFRNRKYLYCFIRIATIVYNNFDLNF